MSDELDFFYTIGMGVMATITLFFIGLEIILWKH